MWDWLGYRGGVAVWKSIDLSHPELSWSTPAKREDGEPATKPTWRAADKPHRTITNPEEIVVVTRREVKRFRVAVRVGHGLTINVTDAGSRRIRREVEKAGDDASYEFDYFSQEAIITVPDQKVPIAEYMTNLELSK